MGESSNNNGARNKHRSHKRLSKKLTAQSLIKLLRKHRTLTLCATVSLTALLVGYLAIELAA